MLFLRAAPLEGKPLGSALRALSRAFTSETGIRVHVIVPAPRAFPSRVEGELFRVAQEALANIRLHAEATEVELSLHQTTRRVQLSIHDNGHGFNPRTVPSQRHGITGMRERARLLRGTLRVRSRVRPPTGTTVVASIPLSGEGR